MLPTCLPPLPEAAWLVDQGCGGLTGPWTACRHPSTLVIYVSRFADKLLALAMEEYIHARQQGQYPFAATLKRAMKWCTQ